MTMYEQAGNYWWAIQIIKKVYERDLCIEFLAEDIVKVPVKQVISAELKADYFLFFKSIKLDS